MVARKRVKRRVIIISNVSLDALNAMIEQYENEGWYAVPESLSIGRMRVYIAVTKEI